MESNGEISSSSPDSGSEERIRKGLQVVVENPKTIYNALLATTEDESAPEIQHDFLNDAVCSFLTTRVDTYRSSHLDDPKNFHFSSTVHTEGQNASISKFTQGYLTEQQIDTIVQALSNQGCTGIHAIDTAHKNGVKFTYKNGEYKLDFGFKSPDDKEQWVKRNLEAERFKDELGLVTYKKDKGRYDGPENENFSLTATPDHYEDSFDDPYLAFEDDITKYAEVYQMFLKDLYQAHGVEEPDKVLKLTYDQPAPPQLRVIK